MLEHYVAAFLYQVQFLDEYFKGVNGSVRMDGSASKGELCTGESFILELY